MRPNAAIALFVTALAVAGPATAETRYLAFDAADRITQALTRGVTFQADRNLLGSISLQRLISTTSRGSAELRRGGPAQVRSALPAGAAESDVYAIMNAGDGRGLTRAFCPGADEAWLVTGPVRLARPLKVHAVGRWTDGTFRHCVALSYAWRGEWRDPEMR